MGSRVRSVTRQEACPLQDERATEAVHAAYPKRDMNGLHGWVYTVETADVIQAIDCRCVVKVTDRNRDAVRV